MAGFNIPGLGEARPNETLPVSSFAPAAVTTTGTQAGQSSTAIQIAAGQSATEQSMNIDTLQPTALTDPHAPVDAATGNSVPKSSDGNSMDADEKPHGAQHIQASGIVQEAQNIESSPGRDTSIAQEHTTQVAVHERVGESNNDVESSAHVTDALDAALFAMSQPKLEDLGPTTETVVKAQAPTTNTEPAPEEGGPTEWEADSSPYESSSESSSSDDSLDDDSESGAMGLAETVRMLMANGDDSDADSDAGGDGKNAGKGRQVRSKNEQPDWIPPKPEVTITEDMDILPLGTILRVVGNTVLIQSGDNGEEQVMDIETAVCHADRSIIGAIADVIGTVLRPMYILRFATSEDVEKEGLTPNIPVFYSPQHAQVVMTRALRQHKGYDASNLHDEEIPMEEQEFSDDEQEQAYKRQQKLKKKGNRGGRGGRGGAQGRETGSDHYGPSGGAATNADIGLNYDDDDDGPYKPLSRPVNFGMGAPPSYEEGATFNGGAAGRGNSNDRGGGRDNFRDRGRGRGRGSRGGFRGGRGGSGGGYPKCDSNPQQDRFPNREQQRQQAPQAQTAAPYQWVPPPPSLSFATGTQHAQHGGAAMPFALPPFPPPAPQFSVHPTSAQPMGQYPPPAAPPAAEQPQANWQAMAALYANPAFQQALRQAQQQQPQQGQPGWGQGPEGSQ